MKALIIIKVNLLDLYYADQISVRNLKCRALDFSENFGGNIWKP